MTSCTSNNTAHIMEDTEECEHLISNDNAKEVIRNTTKKTTVTSCTINDATHTIKDTEEREFPNLSTPLLSAADNSSYPIASRTEQETTQIQLSDSQVIAQSHNSAMMMMILIGASIAAIQLLPIFMACTQTKYFIRHVHTIGNIIYDIYCLCTGIVAVIFLSKLRKWRTTGWIKTNPTLFVNGIQHNGNSAALQTRWYQKIQQTPKLTLFAMLTLLYLICSSWKHTIDHPTLNQIQSDSIGFVLYTFTFTSLMLFNACYNNVILQTCSVFCNIITFMIGGVFCIGLTVTFRSLYVLAKYCKEETLRETNLSYEHEKTPKYVVSNISGFLEPFAIEYITLTIGLWIKLWNTMYEKHEIDESDSVEENNNNDNTTSVSGSALENENVSTTIFNKVMKGILVALSLLVAICYIASYIVLSNHFGNSLKADVATHIYIWEGITFGLYLPQCVFIIFSWNTIGINRLKWSTSLTSRDFFLLGFNVVVYLYGLLRVFLALAILSYPGNPSDVGDRPSHGEIVAVLLFTIFSIFQVYAQSRYLLMANSQQEHCGSIGSTHKYMLLYTASLNVAEWLILSLGHVWSVESQDSLVPLFNFVFSSFTTELVKVLFYPVITFYKFHCAVLCYEIYKEM